MILSCYPDAPVAKAAAMPSDAVGAFISKVDSTRAEAMDLAGLSMSDDEEAKDKYPWDDCIADQMKQYGDKATAEKVCGKIKAQSQGKSASVQSDVEKAIKNNEAILKQIKNDPEIDSKWVKALESQIASHRKMLDQIKSRGKSAADQMLRKAFVPDTVDGWLEWEDGTRTAAKKEMSKEDRIRHLKGIAKAMQDYLDKASNYDHSQVSDPLTKESLRSVEKEIRALESGKKA